MISCRCHLDQFQSIVRTNWYNPSMAVVEGLLDEFGAEPRDEVLPDGTHVRNLYCV